MTRLRRLWNAVDASYWFRPSLFVAGALVLAPVCLWIDRTWPLESFGERAVELLGVGDVGSARSILSTIASATITIASLSFSVTLVALTLASSQFGTRLIQYFLRDRLNQVALGAFVGTFVYCLSTLRALRGVAADERVPHHAVNLAIVLGILAILALVSYFHHVARSLQADRVVRRGRHELDRVLEDVSPREDEGGFDEVEDDTRARLEALDVPVRATAKGYVQTIDYPGLLERLAGEDRRLHLLVRVGEHVLVDQVVARCDGDGGQACLAGVLHVGSERTALQDLEHTVLQLVDVAVRALSPGVNDPQTAVRCLDELTSVVAEAARRPDVPRVLAGEDGEPRLLRRRLEFAELADAAFHGIRRYAAEDLDVLLAFVADLERVAHVVADGGRREVLRAHLDAVAETAEAAARVSADRERVRAALDRARGAFAER